MNSTNGVRWGAVGILALAMTPVCSGITFTGVSGGLAASAEFTVAGNDLVVTLTNTAASDVMVPSDLLGGVYWNSAIALNLTRTSAALGAGSVVHFGSTDPGGVVGGEFGYRGDITALELAASGVLTDQQYGISANGLDVFGPPDLFPGTDLDPPASPNGMNYGITSAGDNTATGNSPVTGDNPLIQNQVIFTLTSPGGLPLGFDPAEHILDVTVQYGTSFEQPSFFLIDDDDDDDVIPPPPDGQVPEPVTAATHLLAMSGLALLASRRRSR